jgi:RNA polymerase sigma factor (TIGR02999 family)
MIKGKWRMSSTNEFTQLLNDCQQGCNDKMNQLFELVYQQLRQIAQQQLRKVWSVETICTTALVNEAYLKMVDHQQFSPANRAHFFAIAATAMRHILINYAEQKQAKKRGGDWQQVTFNDPAGDGENNLTTLIAVNEALSQVNNVDESLARLVELRFFAGMNEAEIALLYDCSERTVRRDWKKAKALLVKALECAV